VKTIVLDENIPRKLKREIFGYTVTTVQENGWGGFKNGKLISLIDGVYDVFITADKNLRYQHNLYGRKISIIELPFNDSDLLLPIVPKIIQAIQLSSFGSYKEIQP
jgi:hypothetical protein